MWRGWSCGEQRQYGVAVTIDVSDEWEWKMSSRVGQGRFSFPGFGKKRKTTFEPSACIHFLTAGAEERSAEPCIGGVRSAPYGRIRLTSQRYIMCMYSVHQLHFINRKSRRDTHRGSLWSKLLRNPGATIKTPLSLLLLSFSLRVIALRTISPETRIIPMQLLEEELYT
jgi:hypothetical protein